jgi:Mrp family chromosome partitioning ATPase
VIYRFVNNLVGSASYGQMDVRLPAAVASQLASLVETLRRRSPKLWTLALVSVRPGEGTSTCVVNLGRYLAGQLHERVLIVDANPYHPTLHTLTGCEDRGGVADLIGGALGIDTAIKHTAIPKLDVLTSGAGALTGAHPQIDATLLRDRVLGHTELYDYVLVDCPAVNVNEAAATMAAACDGVILVVDGRTNLQAAQAAKTLLLRANCNILGVFMNKRRFHIPQFLYDRL